MTQTMVETESGRLDRQDHIPVLHRLVSGFIGLNAAGVAYFGLLKPRTLDRGFTWADLPPLHARFVGALYLFGAVLLLGSLVCRRWASVAPLMTGSAIFTTSMFVLTFVNFKAFDFNEFAPRAWIIAYTVFPLMTWPLALAQRQRKVHEPAGLPSSRWLSIALRVLAAVFAVIGVVLFLARSIGADAWPWKVSSGVAQFYGGPFLTLACCAWWYSRCTNRRSLTLYATAMAALGVSVVAVSIKHRSLFDVGDPAAWLWFALFGAIALSSVVSLVALVPATRPWAHRRAAPVA